MKKINATTKEYKEAKEKFIDQLQTLVVKNLDVLVCADMIREIEAVKMIILYSFVNDEAV